MVVRPYEHRHNGFTMQLYRPATLKLPDIVTHHSCTHNARVGLASRHLLDNNPAPEWLSHTTLGTELIGGTRPVWKHWTQESVMETMTQVRGEWVGDRRITPAPLDACVEKFSGAKRNRNVESLNKALLRGTLDFGVTAFVKADKYDPLTAETKAPRMIQFRDPAVNLALSRVMGPAEHELLGGPGMGPTRLPDCSKGMTPDRVAQVWLEKSTFFDNPVALLGDYSKFDAHVHTHMLSQEHAVWREVSGLKMELLDEQLINKGTSGSISYTAVGTRMSGDRNTGGGNSILNILIFRTLQRMTGIPIEVLCDGDDSVVWLQRKHLSDFVEAANLVIPRVFGMQWTYAVALSPPETEYCHRTLSIATNGEPRLLPDGMRALSRALWLVNVQGPRQLGPRLIGNLVSLLTDFPHMPVVAPVAYGLLKRLHALSETGELLLYFEVGEGNVYMRDHVELGLRKYRQPDGKVVIPSCLGEVDEIHRLDYAVQYNMSVAEQLLIEREYLDGEFNPIALKGLRVSNRARKTRPREELFALSDHTVPEYW